MRVYSPRAYVAAVTGTVAFAAGCGGSPPDEDVITAPSTLSPRIVSGTVADGGFGLRLVRSGDRVVIGAPLAARASTLGNSAHWGAAGSFFGAGLAALDDGRVLVGAPGAGEIVDYATSEPVATGEALGGVVAARGDRWVASMHSGVRWDEGTVELVGRPSALALGAGDTLVAGFASGDVAARIGTVVVPRAAEGDEEGYAVALGDVDGDGVDDVVLGAPGVAEVRVYDGAGTRKATVTGAGRFGAALAIADGVLWVGAPLDAATAGAVYAVRGLGAPELLATGTAAGDELGAALIAGHGNVIAGAPGGPGAVGYVQVWAP